MTVTIFYATLVAWEQFPFGRVPKSQRREWGTQSPWEGSVRLMKVRSSTDPMKPRTARLDDAAQDQASPRSWIVRTKAPTRFRVEIDGRPAPCRREVQVARCVDGTIAYWSATTDTVEPPRGSWGRTGEPVTVRIIPVNATAPWSVEVVRDHH